MQKKCPHRETNQHHLAIPSSIFTVQQASHWVSLMGVVLFGITGLVTVVHAAAPLSDDELDARYLDVPLKSPYMSKVEYDKATSSENTGAKTDSTTFFSGNIAVVFTNALETPLLAGIDQNTRLLGNADQTGVSVGVSSTAIPLAFGSENFSYKWAGNLDQVFAPTPEGSRVIQYVYNANGAEIWYVPATRTGTTETFVHN